MLHKIMRTYDHGTGMYSGLADGSFQLPGKMKGFPNLRVGGRFVFLAEILHEFQTVLEVRLVVLISFLECPGRHHSGKLV